MTEQTLHSNAELQEYMKNSGQSETIGGYIT